MKVLEVIIAPAAQRDLKKLERRELKQAIKDIESLARDPRPKGVEKLKAHPKFYRIYSGADHRIVYNVFQEKLVVILLVRDRKDAYRSLGDLDGKLATVLHQIEKETAVPIQLRVATR